MNPGQNHLLQQLLRAPRNALTTVALLLVALSSLSANSSPPEILLFEPTPDSLLLEAVTPEGEMWIERSTDLVNWESIEYRLSHGSNESFSLPKAAPGAPQFFRVVSYPAATGFYTHGPFASEAKELIQESTLIATFGLAAIDTNSGYPTFDNLASASRDRRIQAALAAGLARLAQELRDELNLSIDPAALVQALESDLADGTLNGLNGSQPVTIPGSATQLPSDLEDNDLVQAFQQAQSLTPGLADASLTFAGGSYSLRIPAVWNQSRWNSAEWQE